jgi:tripartite ATP-independent transporter DctM subunit
MILRRLENSALSLALAAMVAIPLLESVMRFAFQLGISGSATIVQHLTLVVGMLGGAVAARENRLLSLSSALTFLKGNLLSAARVFSCGMAASITLLLTAAAAQFVATEFRADKTLVYGIPLWVVELVLPFGFAAVAWRLLRHAGETWKLRLLAAALCLAVVLMGVWSPIAPSRLVIPALMALLAATIAGAPVFTTLGGAALILFWGDGQPIASLPVDHYRLVVNPSFPTIPLFTLAGYFLAEGGASQRLLRVFQAAFGRLKGGPAIVTALVCAFFTTFTGASGVTILALAGLLMPILLAARCGERSALGLLTSAGSLGLLFPPCLPLILYAIIAKVSIDQMFLAGLLPGTLLVVLTALWGIYQSPASPRSTQPFDFRELASAFWAAKWEMLFPVVAVVSLFAGFATPVEAAAITALYAFVVEAFLYRDLKLKDAPRVTTECGLLIGGVLLILGVALGFTNYLVDAEVPTKAVDWLTTSVSSPLVFLLILNVFLLIVGALMDIYSAIIVVVPLIAPLGLAYGIDPVHLGIVFLANMELGYLTPPVGMNLFLASYRLNKPLPEVYRSVIPMLLVLLLGVLLITYIPALTTTLPRWFAR